MIHFIGLNVKGILVDLIQLQRCDHMCGFNVYTVKRNKQNNKFNVFLVTPIYRTYKRLCAISTKMAWFETIYTQFSTLYKANSILYT